ncbi:MAG TPA: UDP-2,3-diacylglucosamine diphosphatase [Burkholderiaceae bacterium]|jgi:UDP-2,3-diacylglucosamine hydrolase
MTQSAMAKKAQSDPIALFVSDLHLQESHPHTTQAFFDFLKTHAMYARQLYLLGDLFEYWAGDDDLVTPYNKKIAEAIRHVSDAGIEVFWIAGNRDFLVGKDFARSAGMTLLPDPYVAQIAGQQIVLAHGDAQCTDDVSYMAFRNQVRHPEWQEKFLSQSLSERKAIIAGMRAESRSSQRTKSMEIMDVNQAAISSLFSTTGTSLMIHGHTHRPARHEYHDKNNVRVRYVLPDWECDTAPVRGGWIEIGSDGCIKRFDINGIELQ